VTELEIILREIVRFSCNEALELFTSSAEESNPKLLPTNAFLRFTMPQKCVDSQALLPLTPYSTPQTS